MFKIGDKVKFIDSTDGDECVIITHMENGWVWDEGCGYYNERGIIRKNYWNSLFLIKVEDSPIIKRIKIEPFKFG